MVSWSSHCDTQALLYPQEPSDQPFFGSPTFNPFTGPMLGHLGRMFFTEKILHLDLERQEILHGGPQNDALEKVDSFWNMAIFGIYVRFPGCTWDCFFLQMKPMVILLGTFTIYYHPESKHGT